MRQEKQVNNDFAGNVVLPGVLFWKIFDYDTYLKLKLNDISALSPAYQYCDNFVKISKAAFMMLSFGMMLDHSLTGLASTLITPSLPLCIASMNLAAFILEYLDYRKETDPVLKLHKRTKFIQTVVGLVGFVLFKALSYGIKLLSQVQSFAFVGMTALAVLTNIFKIISAKKLLSDVQNNALKNQAQKELSFAYADLFANLCFLAFASGVMVLGITTGAIGAVFVIMGILSLGLKLANSYLNHVGQDAPTFDLFPNQTAETTAGEIKNNLDNSDTKNAIIDMIDIKIQELEQQINRAGLFGSLQHAKRQAKISALNDLKQLIGDGGQPDSIRQSVKAILSNNPKALKSVAAEGETFKIFKLVTQAAQNRAPLQAAPSL